MSFVFWSALEWRCKRSVGSHRDFTHPERRGPIYVPFHRHDLKRRTNHGIITDAGLTAPELIKLLRG